MPWQILSLLNFESFGPFKTRKACLKQIEKDCKESPEMKGILVPDKFGSTTKYDCMIYEWRDQNILCFLHNKGAPRENFYWRVPAIWNIRSSNSNPKSESSKLAEFKDFQRIQECCEVINTIESLSKKGLVKHFWSPRGVHISLTRKGEQVASLLLEISKILEQ